MWNWRFSAKTLYIVPYKLNCSGNLIISTLSLAGQDYLQLNVFYYLQGAAGIQQFCKGFVKEAFDMVKEKGGVCIHDEVIRSYVIDPKKWMLYYQFQGSAIWKHSLLDFMISFPRFLRTFYKNSLITDWRFIPIFSSVNKQ